MVRKLEAAFRAKHKNRIKVDVIILGCTLPGIVTAHKLKKRFGDSMDIVVLDLIGSSKRGSMLNVAFQETDTKEETETEDSPEPVDIQQYDNTARQVVDNVARYYLARYAKEFHVPLPDAIAAPEHIKSQLNKVFQHRNGKTVDCPTDYHDFNYLNFMEKFELNQYQTLLDQSMKMLFHTSQVTENERNSLLYYDQTTMEKHICNALFFSNSREIMRMTVRLVCGAPAHSVSVLFYLHQCYRTSSSRNHLDGDNTRFREKLIGYCGQRLAHKLQQDVADITRAVKNIKEIRTCPEDRVIVETVKGEATYVCSLLAMALKPHDLHKIRVEDGLLSKHYAQITRNMVPGLAKKFVIQYEENFWSRQGYSGDILSIRGPIIWAMERPKMSTTGSTERYSALIGYLMVRDDVDTESKEAVVEQLVKLFGEEAASPATYRESRIADVFVPRCGDYVALRRLANQDSPKFLEWASLDIFAEGDIAAALEAGHTAYIHLLSCLRPQAQTYEDLSDAEWPTFLNESPVTRWMSHINWVSGMRWSAVLSVTLIALHCARSFMRK